MLFLAQIFSKGITWVILAGLALLGFVYFSGKSAGKRKVPKDTELPNAGSGIPVIGTDQNGKKISWSPNAIVSDLFDALNGSFVMAATKEELFIRMLDLTDDQLTAVYNKFDKDHYDKDNGTMTQWIKDEFNVSIGSVRDELVRRLQNLRLT
jgi:hypothetical protein